MLIRVIAALGAVLGLGFPWATVPTHMGIGVGGFPLFLDWLTKYPNFGPLNRDIFLGMVCVIGCSSLPLLAVLYEGLSSAPSRMLRRTLVWFLFVLWLPVVVMLDLGLLFYGLWTDPEALGGPLLRLGGVLGAVWGLRASPRGKAGEGQSPIPGES